MEKGDKTEKKPKEVFCLAGEHKNNSFPNKAILLKYVEGCSNERLSEKSPDEEIIIAIFKRNGTKVWVEEIKQGPTFRQYRVGFKKGTLNSQLLKQSEVFAQNLCVESVRIIPPGSENPFILIEVPNSTRFTVGFDSMVDVLESSKASIPMALGMDVNGDSVITDLTNLRHVLLLGDTGSGKTIWIHSLVNSILFSRTHDQVRFIMADLNDFELPVYNGISHLLSPVMTEPKDVLKGMENLCSEMERRMMLIREKETKSISAYNEKAEENHTEKLPHIVFIIDEFAPLMIEYREQFEYWIKRITTVARFCGIHFVLSTIMLDREIISGVISYNIPTVISFRVKETSKLPANVIDKDAVNLLGRGEFLFPDLYSGTSQRIQGAFIEPEIREIVEFFKSNNRHL